MHTARVYAARATMRLLDAQTRAVLMAYLAVAHHGRGRGDWAAVERPGFWAEAVDATLASQREALHAAWALRDPGPADRGALAEALQRWLAQASGELLRTLYPGSGGVEVAFAADA